MSRGNAGERYSPWLTLDRTLFAGVLFVGAMPAMLYQHCRIIWACMVPALIFTYLAKRLYSRSYDRSAAFKWVTGILRAIAYTVIIGGMLLPFFIAGKNTWKWAYPLKRKLFLDQYGRNAQIADYLPERLPAKADGYSAQFVPKFLQGAARVNVCYYTDSATVAQYKQTALGICKKHLVNEPELDEFGEEKPVESKWFALMQQNGASAVDMDGAEAFVLYEGYENVAVWMLNEKTGYFRIYW